MEYTCARCHRSFQAKPADCRIYCSRACYLEVRQIGAERVCGLCGKTFMRRASRPAHYCSRQCRDEAGRKPYHYRCERCGKERIVRAHMASYARFCSYACRAYTLSVGIHIGIKNPERKTQAKPYETPYYQKQASRAKKRDNYQCQHCGRQFEKGRYGLDCHHILPIRDGGSNHLSNLTSLCRACHRTADLKLERARRDAAAAAVQEPPDSR